ncbi:MAG: DUF4011 domain-containing protein [Pseudorhizobium pelagicum]|uniref:DUF4011 domain-containing protein n=1 Tax=Pseudorhizobium pelagicum TaxID=1509405 RepID=UPI00346015A9
MASKIEDIRPRLLDLTSRNPLISMSFNSRSSSQIQLVDELPDCVFYTLNNGGTLKFAPLPSLDEDTKDEQRSEFVEAYSIALRTDEVYIEEAKALDTEALDYPDNLRKVERSLKDRVREQLGMPKRITRKDESLAQHARNHGINPSYELPVADEASEDERYDDDFLQTLFLPPDLERKLNGLVTKARTAQQETGLNLLRGAFGFLEWKDPARSDGRVFLSPLVLAPVAIERRKTAGGPIYQVEGADEEAETNLVLREKFKREFAIDLPLFDGGSVESYFEKIASIEHAKLPWQVRRRITFSVFPAARMAMYEDLNTEASDFSRNSIIETILVGSDQSEPGAIANEYDVDAPEIEAEVPHLVKKADASQFSVLVDVAKGRNLAVEGPPGTGKSDTIVNAIATALAKGKRVLFVAEKSAALEVVRNRLEAVGLGEFLLPLLAGKSSKDELMRSIRGRLGVRESMPRELADTRQRYIEVRDKLSRYVTILSSEWEGTGETVHTVIGRAIATQGRLESLSNLHLTEHKLPVRNFRKHEAEELLAAVKRLDELRCSPISQRTQWRSTRCFDTSQFKISAILASAERASVATNAVVEALEPLANYGVPADLTPGEFKELQQLSEQVERLLRFPLSGSDARIAVSSQPGALRALVTECSHAQDLHERLFMDLPAPLAPDTEVDLLRLFELARQAGVETLDPTDRSGQIAMMEMMIELLDGSLASAQTFLKQVPTATGWTVSVLRQVADFIQATPRGVLALRNPALGDPAAVAILRDLCTAGIALRTRRAELGKALSIRPRMKSSDIDGPLAIIRRAGFLSFLSPSYRQAKDFYLSISKRAKFDTAAAVEELGSLRDQLDLETSLEERSIRSGVFGARFDGLDTNFDDFMGLASFHERMNTEFMGFESRDIRELLASAPIDLLIGVPLLDGLPRDTKLKDLPSERDRMTQDLERLRSTDEELTALAKLLREPSGISPDRLPGLAAEVATLRELVTRLDESQVGSALETRFAGWRTKVAEIEPLVEVAELLSAAGDLARPVAHSIDSQEIQTFSAQLRHFIQLVSLAENALSAMAEEAECDVTTLLADEPYRAHLEFLSEAAKDRDALEHWMSVGKVRDDIDRHALLETVDLLIRQMDGKTVLGHVEALLYRAAAGRVYALHGRELSSYSGKDIDILRSRLKRLDDDIRVLSRKALRSELISASRPPAGTSRGRVGDYTEMGLLEHLVDQKKIRVPVRDITRRAGRALLALKPVWMMSPLAVAQYIPKNSMEFDICIIDEASQMPPEDAIGALFRSRQAMVVGDTQQLPPTNFFQKTIAEGNDDEEADVVTEESILEMANSAFRPRRMLTWHYRSRHSGLIKFSNNIIYQDRLTVFPSANEDHPKMGVRLVSTGGLYKTGLNTTEAHAVVEAALQFMRSDPNRSLGIVAVNKAQAEYINERLQYEIARDKIAGDFVDRWLSERDGLEEFFVKNLENVQGDERDVIFVSTVYGPPSEGAKVAQHFGPIAGPTGRRRLNVLFTRAKEQICTFTSMTSSDITAEPTTNPGAWMLKRWLEYSAGGPLDAGTGTHGAFDSPLEEFVATQIEAMGCVAVPQVGAAGYSIDLGVRHPHWANGFIMGVECDGATYHSSRSARDRDRHRQEILEALGWKIHRIWSTDWFDNPRREAERLREAISSRVEELKARLVLVEPQVVVAQTTPPVQPLDVVSPSQTSLELGVPAPTGRPAAPETQAKRSRRLARLGSTVRLRYLDRGQETFQFKIVKEASDPPRGLVNQSAPLAKSVIDRESGEEIEVLLGSHIRKAMIEAVN